MTYKQFPKPVSIKKLLGPSFIILALGLGSGEVILWPYLVSNHGLGIAWGAVLGISFQYFINTEIERYSLFTGESVFVGLNKRLSWTKYWFILSTFVGFGLPGIIAASAQVFAFIFGFQSIKWFSIFLLLLIGFMLSIGKTVYSLVEKLTKSILIIGVPLIFLLALIIASKADWAALFSGMFGFGQGYYLFPSGISFITFFAAFAYSGAGGNLNLTQSIYIKEKGYGMGKYSQKISGLFTKKGGSQEISLQGTRFKLTKSNIKNAQAWWNLIKREHLFVFWFAGAFSMVLLMLLSYSTAYGNPSNSEGIQFVINQGKAIGQLFFPGMGAFFLGLLAIMLFQTQLGILDSTSRIMSENAALIMLGDKKNTKINMSKIYYQFLWSQIFFGIVLFLLNITEPKTLIVLGAIINAVAMFVHIGLVSYLNQKELPDIFKPRIHRRFIMALIFLFFGFFSVFVIGDKIF